VRLAALDGLKLCATFEQAEPIYQRLKPEVEPVETVRQRAWTALEVLFPKADVQQLNRWADRFMNDHNHRYFILKILADQLQQQGKAGDLAAVQQNIGQELLLSDSPEDAAKYFEAALDFYKKQGGAQMTVADLSDQYIEALLKSGQYQKAAEFAASAKAANQGNQQTIGAKLRNEVDMLRKKRDFENALKLIAEIKKMKPALSEVFMGPIAAMEQEIRDSVPAPAPTRPASAPVNATTH
jgi:tetratricopeptide (TPR) repeat protein